MKVTEKLILLLIGKYGPSCTLSEIHNILKQDRPHKCPRCNTSGQIEYNAYPSGLPDSGSVYKAGYKECSVCEGFGYTKVAMKPISKIVGYEEQ